MCACVYVPLAVCSQTCRVIHHVLLLMQGRCCSSERPCQQSCQRTFQQVALDFYFVLTAVTQGSASCTSLMDFFLMYGPHLPFPLVSALLWTHCPVGFCHYRFRLDPLGSSDGCAWCGCGVLMVVFGVVVELWRLCLSLRGWRREVPWCGDVWWRGTALRLAQGLLAHLSGHPQGMCCHSNCR